MVHHDERPEREKTNNVSFMQQVNGLNGVKSFGIFVMLNGRNIAEPVIR